MRRGEEPISFYDNIGNGLFKPEVRSQKSIRLKGFLLRISAPLVIIISALLFSWLLIRTISGESEFGHYLRETIFGEREITTFFWVYILSLVLFLGSLILLIRVLITIYRWWKIVNMDGLWVSSDAYVDTINRVRFDAGHKLFLDRDHIYYRAVKYGFISKSTIYALTDLDMNIETRLSGRRNCRVKVWIGPINNENGKKATRILKRYISWMKESMEPLGGDMSQREDLPNTYHPGVDLIGAIILDSLTDAENE